MVELKRASQYNNNNKSTIEDQESTISAHSNEETDYSSSDYSCSDEEDVGTPNTFASNHIQGKKKSKHNNNNL